MTEQHKADLVKQILKFGLEKDAESAKALVEVHCWLESKTNEELYHLARTPIIPPPSVLSVEKFDKFQAFLEDYRLKKFGKLGDKI